MPTYKLPVSVEAEKALLGTILQYPASLSVCHDQGLEDADFSLWANQRIYRAINELDHQGKGIDSTTLATILSDQGDLNNVGGLEYLLNLIDLGSSYQKALQYVDIVKNKSLLRKLIITADNIAKEASEKSDDISYVMDIANSEIRKVTESRQRSEFISSHTLTKETIDYISSIKENHQTGVFSGFSGLDRNTNGFQKGSLVILAARTSVGKTAFAVNLAVNAATRYKKCVAFFTLEMSAQEIMSRMIAVDGHIRADRLRNGDLTPDDYNALNETEQSLGQADIYIDDNSMIKVSDIMGKCRKLASELKAKGKTLDLVIIDYLQLITASRNSDSRQQEVSEISKSLKQAARELDCPVIALSQLSRDSVKRKDTRPQLSDLRESGAIEQDADIVLFLHNAENAPTPQENRPTQLIIGKFRQGALRNYDLMFDTSTGIFNETTKMEAPQ